MTEAQRYARKINGKILVEVFKQRSLRGADQKPEHGLIRPPQRTFRNAPDLCEVHARAMIRGKARRMYDAYQRSLVKASQEWTLFDECQSIQDYGNGSGGRNIVIFGDPWSNWEGCTTKNWQRCQVMKQRKKVHYWLPRGASYTL